MLDLIVTLASRIMTPRLSTVDRPSVVDVSARKYQSFESFQTKRHSFFGGKSHFQIFVREKHEKIEGDGSPSSLLKLVIQSSDSTPMRVGKG
jgi:hypothetical protein